MMYNIPEKIKTHTLRSLILCSLLIFSYHSFNGWWNSAIGTILIIIFSYFLWGKDFLKNIGLEIGKYSIIISIVLSFILSIFSFLILSYIGQKRGIQFQLTEYRYYIHDIFRTLNEEIILGAILLFYLLRRIKNHPLIISTAVAFIFSLVHFIFYKWIFLERGLIHPVTLATLFLVGFMRNNLIIRFKHIGYSWAFHFGWVAIMFGSTHFYSETGMRLTEPELFNIYLGSYEMLIVSIILAILSIFLYSKT